MSGITLIGFCGLAGSGKSTAASILMQRGWSRLSFATPLKEMARAFGLSDRELAGDLKEIPAIDLCGKTPRQFMQFLGTEFGRQLIGEDIWLRAFQRRVHNIRTSGQSAQYITHRIVVDDVRFENEADLIREMGGRLIRIERPGAGSATGSAHPSEAGIRHVDEVLVNAGTLEDLQGLLQSALGSLH